MAIKQDFVPYFILYLQENNGPRLWGQLAQVCAEMNTLSCTKVDGFKLTFHGGFIYPGHQPRAWHQDDKDTKKLQTGK